MTVRPTGVPSCFGNWQQSERIELLTHAQNQGKGAAIRSGLACARGQFTIIQDADLEYDPQDYGRLIQPLLDGEADVVYGSRRLGCKRDMAPDAQPVLSWRYRLEHVRAYPVWRADHRRSYLLQGVSDYGTACDGPYVPAIRVLPGSDGQGMPHGTWHHRSADPIHKSRNA